MEAKIPRVSFRKNGEILAGDGYKEQQAMKEKEQEYQISYTNRNTNTTSDQIVKDIIHFNRISEIPTDVAASMIVNRIRVAFIRGLRNVKNSFNNYLAMCQYLDEILFKDLVCIVVVALTSQRKTFDASQIMNMIVDTSEMIEYHISNNDYILIRNILGDVFKE